MASELTINASLAYDDAESVSVEQALANFIASVSSKKVVKHRQTITITEVAINLGSITAPGWALFINRDATNFIELRVATAGAKFAKLKAGECALLRLGSGAQAPFAIADTGSCDLEYMIAST